MLENILIGVVVVVVLAGAFVAWKLDHGSDKERSDNSKGNTD